MSVNDKTFNYDSTTPAESAGYRDIAFLADWSDRLVTVVATGLAVLIVAIVAVLMGMA
jgi:hypothetical protein